MAVLPAVHVICPVRWYLAVNMLDPGDLKEIIQKTDQGASGMSQNEKTKKLIQLLHQCAKGKGIVLDYGEEGKIMNVVAINTRSY